MAGAGVVLVVLILGAFLVMAAALWLRVVAGFWRRRWRRWRHRDDRPEAAPRT
ncbi:MAG: hypothetical protein R3343_03410 [Nitriliruptorales bacterium]|nr:hypothetical protein [Nitriliruptorales bacterium]